MFFEEELSCILKFSTAAVLGRPLNNSPLTPLSYFTTIHGEALAANDNRSHHLNPDPTFMHHRYRLGQDAQLVSMGKENPSGEDI